LIHKKEKRIITIQIEDKNIAPKIVREQVIKHVMNIKKRDLPYYSMDLFDDKGVSVGYIKYKYS